jgi:O-antigen/teichoic acid export membrane protein
VSALAPAPVRPLGPATAPLATDATSNEAAASATPPVNPELVRAQAVPQARKTGKNTIEILLFRGLSTPLALFLVVLQSRFLAAEGRGTFVLAVLTVSIFSRLLSQLGVAVANRMGHKEWDEPRELHLLTQRAFGLAVALGVAGGVLIVGIGAVTPSVGAATAAVAAVGLAPNVVWQTASGILLGLNRIRAWNYVQLASPLLTVVGTLILVVGLGGGVRAGLAAWTCAHFVTALIALVLTRDVWRPFRFGGLADKVSQALIRLALTMGALQVVALIGYRIELFVLQAIDGVREVGVYSIAEQTAESVWLIAAAIATAITAQVVRASEPEAVALVRRSLLRSVLYTVAAAGAVAVAAPFVIPAALGSDFDHAATPLLLLMPGAVAYAPIQILVVYLSVRRGRAGLSLAAGIVSMLVTLAAAVPLVLAFGASGAAAASATGYACGGLVAWFFFKRETTSAPTSLPAATPG